MSFPSPTLGANELSRILGCDVRTLKSHVEAGTFPGPTSVHPTNGRAQWDRAQIVNVLRTAAVEADETAKLFDTLKRLAKTAPRVEDRVACERNLRALMDGSLDVQGLLEHIEGTGR